MNYQLADSFLEPRTSWEQLHLYGTLLEGELFQLQPTKFSSV